MHIIAFALYHDLKNRDDFVAEILTSVSVKVPAHRSLGVFLGTVMFHTENPGGTEEVWGGREHRQTQKRTNNFEIILKT